MTDNVNHPSHYNNGSVECIDAMEAATVNKSGAEAICTSNVIKYLWRYEAKNGLEDVKKAQWYLNRLIAELEGKAAVTPGSEPECNHVWTLDLVKDLPVICIYCGKVQEKHDHVWVQDKGDSRRYCVICRIYEDGPL